MLERCYYSIMDTDKSVKPITKHINMRFPSELAEELKRVARENGRSLHAEILWALREYLKRRKDQQA